MKRVTYAALLCSISILLAVIGSLTSSNGRALANGVPHEIILTYLQGLSNWGPTAATGVAEVVPREGLVSIRVVGLPSLSNESYHAWLVNSQTNQSLSVGRFNTDKSETTKVQTTLPSEIPDFGWDLFLITVEPNGQNPKSPGNQKSIGGYISDSAEAKPLPSQLPKTGGETDGGASRNNPPISMGAASGSQSDSTNSFVAYGVVVLAAVGVGIVTRTRMRRR